MGIEHLVWLIHPDNQGFIRVALKIGSAPEGEYDLHGTRHLIYGQVAPRRDRPPDL